jgi:NAD-dependent SIR2 family protein deacetylase
MPTLVEHFRCKQCSDHKLIAIRISEHVKDEFAQKMYTTPCLSCKKNKISNDTAWYDGDLDQYFSTRFDREKARKEDF